MANDLFEYVAWFRDESLPVDDEDYEWPGVIYVWAHSAEAARAWGDHLAAKGMDLFLHSTVSKHDGPEPETSPIAVDGQELSADELGW